MSTTTPCAATGGSAGGLQLQHERSRRSAHAAWVLFELDARHDPLLGTCLLAGGDLHSRRRAGALR